MVVDPMDPVMWCFVGLILCVVAIAAWDMR
jgi:hypothetical protein